MGNAITTPICQIVGFLYPAYRSFKALNTPSDQDDKQWLTYWIVLSFFYVTEYYISYIPLIPFYFTLKLAFLIYLQLGGATFIYSSFIEPFLNKNEKDIDIAIKNLGTTAATQAGRAAKAAFTAISQSSAFKQTMNQGIKAMAENGVANVGGNQQQQAAAGAAASAAASHYSNENSQKQN